MSEEKQQEATTAVAEKATEDTAAPAADAKEAATDAPAEQGERGPRRRRGGNDCRNQRRGRRGGRQTVRPEFDQKIVSIRRVTRVMAGGRRFSFSVSMVIGDKKGKVGWSR